MSKFLFSLFTILLFTIFTTAQSKSNEAISEQIKSLRAEKQIQLEYDKSSNY